MRFASGSDVLLFKTGKLPALARRETFSTEGGWSCPPLGVPRCVSPTEGTCFPALPTFRPRIVPLRVRGTQPQ